MEKMKKLNVNDVVKAYEMLSKKDRDLFEKEIQNKREHQFEILRNDRNEKAKLAKKAREAELNKMEREIVHMLKQALPKVEYLIKYDTFEGHILHVWPYMEDWCFDAGQYEFYYKTYYFPNGDPDGYPVGIGYSRSKGFSFVYRNSGRSCTSIRIQHNVVHKFLKMLDEEYDEIIKEIDDEVDSIISGRRHGDRDTKSCYKF